MRETPPLSHLDTQTRQVTNAQDVTGAKSFHDLSTLKENESNTLLKTDTILTSDFKVNLICFEKTNNLSQTVLDCKSSNVRTSNLRVSLVNM